MELSLIVKEKLLKVLKDRLQDRYKTMMPYFTDEPFGIFLAKIISEVENEVSVLTEVTKEDVQKKFQRIHRTKYRWFNKEQEKGSELMKEIDAAKRLYKTLSLNGELNKIKLLYGNIESYKDIEITMKKKFKTWLQNEFLLTDFRYLSTKKKHQIKKAFYNDAMYICFQLLNQKYPHGKRSDVTEYPYSMTTIPIDQTNRVKFDTSKLIIKSENEKYFRNLYVIDDDSIMHSLVDIEVLQKMFMAKTLRVLGERDVNIFFSVLSKRKSDFFATRTIEVNIGSIVKDVYKSKNKANYLRVKDSLYKMSYLTTGIVNRSLDGFTFRLLDKVTTKGNTAYVVVSSDVVNDFLEDRTVKMYTDVINNLKLESSRILIFRLQKERINCYTENKTTFNTDLNYFKRALYLTNKRKDRNIKVIEKALDEIVEHKVTLKSYKRRGDMFELEFYPITEREKRDLLGREGEEDYAITYKKLIGYNSNNAKDIDNGDMMKLGNADIIELDNNDYEIKNLW